MLFDAEVVSDFVVASEGAPVKVTIPFNFSCSRSASVDDEVGLAVNVVAKKSAFVKVRLGSSVFIAGMKSRTIRSVRAVVSTSRVWVAGKANQAAGLTAEMPGTLSR